MACGLTWFVLALLMVTPAGCGGSTPPTSELGEVSASRGPAESTRSLADVLAASESAYARAHAQLVVDAIDTARDEAARASAEHCRADATATLDEIESLLMQRTAVTDRAVEATLEVRLRLAACSTSRCDVVGDGQARLRAAVWLGLGANEVSALAAEGGAMSDPMWRGIEATTREDWELASTAFAEAARAATSCLPREADALVRLAATRQRRGDAPAATEALERAVAIARDATAPRILGDALLALGYARAAERDYVRATPFYERAVEAYRLLGSPGVLLEADALNARAVALGELQRVYDAIQTNEEVARRRAELLGDGHPRTLISLSNIAVMSERAGQRDRALQMHQRILSIRERMLPEDDASLAVSLDAVARGFADRGDGEEARTLCARSIRVRAAAGARRDLPRSHICMANALGVLGRFDEALEEATRAVELARGVQGASHPDVAGYLLFRASLADHAGRADLAAESRAEAARIRP